MPDGGLPDLARPDAGPPDILARLRAETREAHEAAECDLAWETRVADLAGYRGLLERLHGFHAAFEPAVADLLDDEAFLAPRRRLGLLARDLAVLGVPAVDLERLPICGALPPLGDRTAAFGALYVMEGSTLGGQIIARRLRATFGFGPLDGGGYYAAHGPATGAMWRAFRERLVAEARTRRDADGMVAAAQDTFAALRVWLGTAEPRPAVREMAAVVA